MIEFVYEFLAASWTVLWIWLAIALITLWIGKVIP